MFYRIIKAPPGFAPDQKYMVAAYETLDMSSKKFEVKRKDGTLFAATLDEARQMMPSKARCCHFEPFGQFLELWEV